MRTCIQLGLGYSTEFIGLTRENWVEYSEDCKEQIQARGLEYKDGWVYSTAHEWTKVPASYADDIEPWVYYGIDVSPESIAMLADKHKENKRANFICVGVGHRTENVEYYLTDKKIDYGDSRYQLNSDRVNFLIVPFHVILKLIDPPTFDVLAVDIDGHETGLFCDMPNWHIYPDFLTMELWGLGKDKRDLSLWHEKLKPYGYELVDIIEHPGGREWYLHECQYIRRA